MPFLQCLFVFFSLFVGVAPLQLLGQHSQCVSSISPYKLKALASYAFATQSTFSRKYFLFFFYPSKNWLSPHSKPFSYHFILHSYSLRAPFVSVSNLSQLFFPPIFPPLKRFPMKSSTRILVARLHCIALEIPSDFARSCLWCRCVLFPFSVA